MRILLGIFWDAVVDPSLPSVCLRLVWTCPTFAAFTLAARTLTALAGYGVLILMWDVREESSRPAAQPL